MDKVIQETVFHNTVTRFGFWGRIKILFGRKLVINSEIKVSCDNLIPEIKVVSSKSESHIKPFFSKCKCNCKKTDRLSVTDNIKL